MSEDLDLKFVMETNAAISKTKMKENRGLLSKKILELIDKSEDFTLNDKTSKNQGSSRCYEIQYQRKYQHSSLRPELKLEFTEVEKPLLDPIKFTVGSIYARETGKDDEIREIYCDALEIILVEKIISLLRRTALVARNNDADDDEALVRHIYDLYFICECNYDANKVKKIIPKIIAIDQKKFGNKHTEFKENPNHELEFGLERLIGDKQHKIRYENFLNPLVYHSNPPSWEQGLNNIENLISQYVRL